MRYVVLPVATYFKSGSRERRTSWQVVDYDAGLNDRKYPCKVVASCRDEADARRICDMFNGVQYWKAEATKWQDKCVTLTAEREQVGDDYRALLNIANTRREAAELELAARRDEARALMAERANLADAVKGLQAAADCPFLHPDARAAFAALAKVYS